MQLGAPDRAMPQSGSTDVAHCTPLERTGVQKITVSGKSLQLTKQGWPRS